VAAVERQQLLRPHRLVVELQQLLHQLLQRIHHHDIYPTSKPLSMRDLL
jgi:hypothetical protein